MELNPSSEKKRKVSVAGLRRADPTTLQVLTQDVLRTPLVRIEIGTLVDLLALSELTNGALPGAMSRELATFQRQMFRELADLPDGLPLAEFAIGLLDLPASDIPSSLRKAIASLAPTRRDADALAALDRLVAHCDTAEPKPVELPKVPEKTSPNNAKVTKIAKAAPPPSDRKGRSAEELQAEDLRGKWIEEDVLSRLRGNISGLKESVLVGGSRHRAPWRDLTEAEVLKVLRRLSRENRTRFSAGRWYAAG